MAKDNFKELEKEIREFWERDKIYSSDLLKKKKIYSVDTPPPTVSGKMHIGHAFSYAQQDFVIRFRRMYGGSVFYPFGTDDNGLPTERLIEKTKKIKSKHMLRKKFINICLDTLKDIRPDFISDWKRLGISADFSNIYSTIDKNSQKISQKSFIELYNKGHIYKKKFPTLWCPECQTSIAQAELEDKEGDSLFSTIIFEVEGKELLIATTRPELLGACVALFVNPQHKSYRKYIGKKAKVPIFGFEVPIISDNSAEIDKGTGAMMVCSYGDKYDVDAVNRHKLEPRIIFNLNGTLNIEKYKDMNIKEARKKILEDLKKENLIKDQKPIKHSVNVHDKCGTEIEFIPTEQWFIRILDNKKKWIELGRKIKWHPEFMRKRYENWVNGLEWDWNISRDRYFGISMPVWKCVDCDEIILAEEKELPVDPLQTKKKCTKCGKYAEPETKVLDTWATSSLTPQIASSLYRNKVSIPFSLRPNSHDIIRTWAFYTIVKSYLHEGKIPWDNIIISGIVSLRGEKMSKSKGHFIDPQDVFEKYGADALRFWAAGSSLGSDLDYQEKDLVTGKKFATKLLNASKFVFMNLKDYDGKSRPKTLTDIDDLFLKKLNDVVEESTKYFLKYDYSNSKRVIEQFFWKYFADNYIEIVKKRIYNRKGNEKLSAQYTLYRSLLTILKLIAPIMPFVAEEVYQEHFRRFETEKSIHLMSWPLIEKSEYNRDNSFDVFVNILTEIRGEKSRAKKPMNSEIVLTLEKSIYKKLESVMEDLKDVMNAKDISLGDKFKVKFL